MVRMEIALFLVLGMVAFMYFTAEKKLSKLHKIFSVLLITVLVHLIFDGITIYTINGLKVIQTSRMRYPDMAFIIVSGYDDFSYCREALRMRITDYILKPVNYEEFGSCIDRLKIALYENRKTEEQDAQEERTMG